MKKFLSILALVLALCLTCGLAMADEEKWAPGATLNLGDYVISNGRVWVIGEVDGETVIVGDAPFNYEKLEKYPELKDATKANIYVAKKADCLNDAELYLRPIYTGEAGVLTWKNGAYVGIPADVATNTEYMVKITLEDLKAAKNPIDVAKEGWKALGHDWEYEFTVPATCTAPGFGSKTCTRCEETVEDVELPKLDHVSSVKNTDALMVLDEGETNADGVTLTKKPTCKDFPVPTGAYTAECELCEEVQNFTFKYFGDLHVAGEKLYRVEPDCVNPGVSYSFCTVCGSYVTKDVYEAPKGHKYVMVYDEENGLDVIGTCKTPGCSLKAACTECDSTVVFNTANQISIDGGKFTYKTNLAKEITGISYGYVETAKGKILMFKTAKDENNHVGPITMKVQKPSCNTAKAPSNNGKGYEIYTCEGCGAEVEKVELPSVPHKTVVKTFELTKEGKGDAAVEYYTLVKAATCTPGKTYVTIEYCEYEYTVEANTKYQKKDFVSSKTKKQLDDKYFTKLDPVAHTFGEWIVVNAPADKIPGRWERECSACGYREDYKGFDAPVAGLGETLALKDGVWAYFKDGKFNSSYSGLFTFNGAQFVITKGLVDTTWNGLKQYPADDEEATWYFFSNGQVQNVTDLVMYADEWFYIEEGMKSDYTGLVDYDGSKFMVAESRILTEYTGLLQDPNNAADWYYLDCGQVRTDYTGVVFYDGAAFYVVNGKLDVDMYGTIEFDGVLFAVVSGQLYPL